MELQARPPRLREATRCDARSSLLLPSWPRCRWPRGDARGGWRRRRSAEKAHSLVSPTQVPTSSVLLTFHHTPAVERHWLRHQAAAWAQSWDGAGRLYDMVQQLLGLAAYMHYPPPAESAVWPLLGGVGGLADNLVAVLALRHVARPTYVRLRTHLVLGFRLLFFALSILVNRHMTMHESLWASPERCGPPPPPSPTAMRRREAAATVAARASSRLTSAAPSAPTTPSRC